MQQLLFALGLLACPLGMLVMGGVAWVATKTRRGPGGPVARMGFCNPLAHAAGRGCDHDRSGDAKAETPSPPASGAEQTFVFADLAGFTALTEAHGDGLAADLAAEFSEAVARLLPEHRAEEVKSLGDGLMLRADDAGEAIRLGLRIVRTVGGRPGFPLVRVGVHTGPAIERDGDWFGAAVNVAARVASAAGGGEVLVSESTIAAAGELDGLELRKLATMRLKNLSEPVDVCAVAPAGEPEGARLPIDPVCRMAVDPEHKAALIVHDGLDYIFCSHQCAARFAHAPEQFVLQEGAGLLDPEAPVALSVVGASS
jgi:adenylate cyclase